MISKKTKSVLVSLLVILLIGSFAGGGYFFSIKGARSAQGEERVVTETWLDHADTTWSGSGTEDDPYQISSAEELAGISRVCSNSTEKNIFVDKYFIQTVDINLGGYNWVPIGKALDAAMFAGHYNGNNHTICGLLIDTTSSYQGLFGAVQGGTIHNINLKESTIKSTGTHIGSLVGMLDSDNPRFGKLDNCHSDAEVVGGNNVGGLVGWLYSSTIDGCSFNGIVEGDDSVGGIVGNMHDGQYNQYIESCINYGIVRGTGAVGGIVGYIDDQTVHITKQLRKCISYGNIKCSTNSAGSIVGSANGPTNITDCTGYGQIIHDGDNDGFYFAGIAGYIVDTVSITNSSFFGSTNITVGTHISTAIFKPIFNYQGANLPSIDSCYALINRKGYYTAGNFSGWSILTGMNDNMPLQKSFYHVAQFGNSIDASWFSSKGYSKVN